MKLQLLVYNAIILPLFQWLLKLKSHTNIKIQHYLSNNQQLLTKKFHSAQPLVMFHCSSVGEYLLAQPLIERFLNQQFSILVSFTSISLEKWLKTNTDNPKKNFIYGYIPLDTQLNMQKLIGKYKPQMLIFNKYDLMPNLINLCANKGIKLYFNCAHMRQNSLMNMLFFKSFFQTLLSYFNAIFPVNAEHKQNFIQFDKTQKLTLSFTGDTRFEIANTRKRENLFPYLDSLKQKETLILGSFWEEDLKLIQSYLLQRLANNPDFRLILAPHEIDLNKIEKLIELFSTFHPVLLSDLNQPVESKVLIINQIGILINLYPYAQVAYIGGGFGQGLHNILEPLAWLKPVIFGGNFQKEPFANEVIQNKIGFCINQESDFQKNYEYLVKLNAQSKFENRIKQFFQTNLGIADKIFHYINT